jgi:carbonic anhydrase
MQILLRAVGLLALLAVARASATENEVHWGYDMHDGPALWGQLSPAWSTCSSGAAQSPVDLGGDLATGPFNGFSLALAPTVLSVAHQRHVVDALDNGHTIQVSMDVDDTLTLNGQDFELLQYHFHAPSEHTVDGRHFPMEMHFVHESSTSQLVVIAVLIEVGAHNTAFDVLWQNLPDTPGERVHLEGVEVDVDDLLPGDLRSWRYLGSLTTPPCTEGVQWIVLQTPITLDKGQIDAFRAIFPHNNRPVQPLHGRNVRLAPAIEAR